MTRGSKTRGSKTRGRRTRGSVTRRRTRGSRTRRRMRGSRSRGSSRRRMRGRESRGSRRRRMRGSRTEMRGTRDGCILTLRKSRPLLFNSLCRNPPGNIIRLQKGGPVWSCILTVGRCWGAGVLRRWCSSSPSDGPFNVLHQSRCSCPAQVKAITAQEVAFNPAVHCKLGMPYEVKLSLLSGHRL